MVNYYSILGLTRNATQDEIKSAYRTLCLKYHPDRCKLQNATQMFQTIEEAYDVLSDDEKKRLFDASLDDGEAFTANQQQQASYADNTYQEEAYHGQSTPTTFYTVLAYILLFSIVIGISGLIIWLFVKFVWPLLLKALKWAFFIFIIYCFGSALEKKK